MIECRRAILQHRPNASKIKTNDIINRTPCALQQNEKIYALVSLSYDFMKFNKIIPLENASNGNP